MPSTYTSSLRLTLPATGELSGLWGGTVNTGVTTLMDAAIAGYISVAMTDADYTLTLVNGATDQARYMMINMTGTLTGAKNVICPAASKVYLFKNSTTGGFAITLKTPSGAGISVPNGKSMLLMCDGTSVLDAVTHFNALTLLSPTLTTPSLSAETFSTSAAVTAGTNAQGQGALTSDYNVITTTAANPSGVTLPTATVGRRVIIVNKGTNSINIYPATSGIIDALAVNTAISLAVNGWIEFNASSTTQWYSTVNTSIAGSFTNLSYSTSLTGVGPATITNNSASAALRVTQTGAGNALLVEDSANPDATPFVIDSIGNVVIGGSATTPGIFGVAPLLSGLATGNLNQLLAAFRNDTNAPFLTLAHSRGATIGSHAAVATGDLLGQITFAGSDGTQFIRGTQISSTVDTGTVSVTSMPARMLFYTTPDGSNALAQRMEIDSNGSIGINSTGTVDGTSLVVSKTITGPANSVGIRQSGTVDLTTATNAHGFINYAVLSSDVVTLPLYIHYGTSQGALGTVGTVLTGQYGFSSNANLIGATTNIGFYAQNTEAVTAGKNAYGFYSSVNLPTGGGTTWGFYGAGTANNYMAGNLGIGITPTVPLHVSGNAIVTGNVQVASLNGNQLAGMRNRVINGGMQVAQRNTLLLTSAYKFGTTDRWLFACLGGTGISGNISNEREPGIGTTVSGWKSGVTSASWTNGTFSAQQRIESKNVIDLTGKTVTFSFKIWQDTGVTRSFNVAFLKPLFVDDFTTVSTITTIAAGSASTNSFTTLSVSYAVGSGEFVNGIGVVISDTAANTVSVKNYYIADCQLEIGVATPLELRPYGLEMALCQRYYEKSFPTATEPAQNLGIAASGATRFIAGKAAATAQFGHVKFSVTKRAAPTTIVFYNPSVANAQVRDTTAGGDLSATAAANASESSFSITATGNASTAVGNALDVAWTADSEL